MPKIKDGINRTETNSYINAGFTDSTVSVNTPQDIQSEIRGSNEFTLTDDSMTKNSSNWRESIKCVAPWTKNKINKLFTKKNVNKRLPILNWLPKYNSETAVGDLIAGLTVGLTLIPQSLAYSNIAGVSPQFGLYGAFMGAFVYIILGSCKDVPVGPTAIVSLMTYQTVGSKGFGMEHVILLTFMVGVIEMLMGIFGLGFLINFVSGPVSSGFTSAVALIILTSQIKDILAIKVTGSTFVQQWISICYNIQDTKPWDVTLGIVCIIVLLLIRVISMQRIGPEDDSLKTAKHNIINKALWVFGAVRNAIVVIICGLIGYSLTSDESISPLQTIGTIPPGLPEFKAPSFSYTAADNSTYGFIGMCSDLGSGLIVVPLIALLENIAICKAFSNGKTVDATQELLALGAGNIASSFVQAYPSTGSVARSAVNNSSGVKTPLAGLYTGLLVILCLIFFTPCFAYIPKASLAAVIIAAVVFMVEIHVVKPMWRSKKSDLIPGVGTFVSCLILQLELGILLGIVLNILFILYHAARPKIFMETSTSRDGHTYIMLTPDRCLIFPSVDYVRKLVTKTSTKYTLPVVIDCSHIYGADYTAARVIHSLTADFRARGQTIVFYNLKPSVCSIFEGVSPKGFKVFYNFEDIHSFLNETSNCKLKSID